MNTRAISLTCTKTCSNPTNPADPAYRVIAREDAHVHIKMLVSRQASRGADCRSIPLGENHPIPPRFLIRTAWPNALAGRNEIAAPATISTRPRQRAARYYALTRFAKSVKVHKTIRCVHEGRKEATVWYASLGPPRRIRRYSSSYKVRVLEYGSFHPTKSKAKAKVQRCKAIIPGGHICLPIIF